MPNRKLVACLIVAAGVAAFVPARAPTTSSSTTRGYTNDNPGNGTCADSGGKCTLNAAIMEGNFRAGSHTITFTPPLRSRSTATSRRCARHSRSRERFRCARC